MISRRRGWDARPENQSACCHNIFSVPFQLLLIIDEL